MGSVLIQMGGYCVCVGFVRTRDEALVDGF